MNSVDSDLEEGEILDDSPSSPPPPPPPLLSNKKDRELPRRYDINKRVHKHRKKDCKNAIRYHAKKLSKCYKKTPSKDMLDNRHDSHSRTKSHKPSIKHHKPLSDRVTKNSPFSKNSLISEIKFSFKDNLKNSHPEKKSNLETHFSDSKHKTIGNDSNFHEYRESSKKNEFPLKSSAKLKENNENYVEKPLDSDNFNSCKELNDDIIVIESSDDKNDESEDEEELRRIALATCAKKKPLLENLNLKQNNDSCASSLAESEQSVQMLPASKPNLVSDNYEIVDMELDEESCNEVGIIDNESLFVIDTQPSSNVEDSVKNSGSESQLREDSDDDFEADILRAELIGSMFRKRAALEKQIEEEENISIVLPKKIPPVQVKSSKTCQKPNVDFQPKPLQPTKRHIFRENGINKHRKMKYDSKTETPSDKIEMSPKRLVITVNAESSSSEEESDEAQENSVPDNPVASIEALISDCRQKSDSSEKNHEAKNNEIIKPVPKALSCLSKAQQEEYNNLRKILEKKEKLPVPQVAHPQNNVNAHSPLNDLKLLGDKLSKLRETLKKKKNLMTSLSKDVNAKKQNYMKSKLRAQHLREQLLAAEKVRRIKLDEWSKSCHNFELVKKSVSGVESKITQMQNLCSKLNLSIQGLSI